MTQKTIRIGGASGYWGDSDIATAQLLQAPALDFLVYDYLAEITMSILARAKAKDPALGYAPDFVTAALRPNLKRIADKGVKVISNAGGLNPEGCAAAVRTVIAELGLDLKVATVLGDDLIGRKDAITHQAPREMFTGEAAPSPDKIASINAYIGAGPIAEALDRGAHIVITGRCVDSAVTLGACMHAFGWRADDFGRLAAGSLAGHLLECGPQVTGGNFTDWERVPDPANIGYPIAEIDPDGAFVVTKPEETGGLVSLGTVAEQLVYEIGDPQAYILPDVVCDFSQVVLAEDGANRIRVSGALGRAPTNTYKTCLTYADGFRAGAQVTFYGFDATKKARHFADIVFERTEAIFRKFNAGEFTEKSVEVIGSGDQLGDARCDASPSEVTLKAAVKHPDIMGAGLFLKQIAGMGLATPPGLSIFAGARPKPSPVIRLFSYLTPKDDVPLSINLDGDVSAVAAPRGVSFSSDDIARPAPPQASTHNEEMTDVPLIDLAWARSGDKGDKANIGVIARQAAFLPFIWRALDEEVVAARFAHFLADGEKGVSARVERYLMPGLNAVNFLLDAVLGGGGVASLRNDPQGKGFGQVLLTHSIEIPRRLAPQKSTQSDVSS